MFLITLSFKAWCAPEFKDAPRINDIQFGVPCTINVNNEYEDILNYQGMMFSKKSIYDRLASLNEKASSNAIWLIHAPPSGMGLDVCAHGDCAGSHAVLKFITEVQPMLTIHGHIHESPEYNGKKWYQKCGNTLCVQNGQLDEDLNYSMIEVSDGKVVSMKHSKYGEALCLKK